MKGANINRRNRQALRYLLSGKPDDTQLISRPDLFKAFRKISTHNETRQGLRA